MNVENFREYCLSFDGVTEKMPFGKFAKRYESILAFYVEGHMFCLVDIDDFTFVDVKSTPDEIDSVRAVYSSLSNPINLSNRHWIQIDFNGDVPEKVIFDFVSRAYFIVKEKYSKNSKPGLAPKRRCKD